MGDLARKNAGARYRQALKQRLESSEEPEELLWTVVTHLERVAIDSIELDRVAHELAADPDAIEFPIDLPRVD